MDAEDYNHKMRLLAIYQDNLRELEVQAARFGANLPLILINEIKFHRQNIEAIRLKLHTNAQEVTFDKLLISIEELRRFVANEVKRAFDAYDAVQAQEYGRSWGVLSLFSFGMLIILGTIYLYQEFVKGRTDGHFVWDGVSIAIAVGGVAANIAVAARMLIWLTRKSREELVRRLGYDPRPPRES
jgi:hypothetical protein